MKRTVIFTVFILSTTLFSCANKSELIAKKWNMQEMEIAEQKLEGSNVAGFSFDIKADGSYKMTAMEEVSGKWKIKGDSFVTINNNATKSSGLLIKELTSDKLVLSGNSEGVLMSMVFTPENK
jgi:uncharacterized protein affecting Mg2+/Co2+ transport